MYNVYAKCLQIKAKDFPTLTLRWNFHRLKINRTLREKIKHTESHAPFLRIHKRDESGKIREYNADNEQEWPDGISRL